VRSGEGLTEAPLRSGELKLRGLLLRLAFTIDGDRAVWSIAIRNASEEPLPVDAVGIGFLWTAGRTEAYRYFRQGFQSWSFAGSCALNEAGTPPFPSGSWLRGFHHALGDVPSDRAGWHDSDGVTAVGRSPSGPTLVAGVLESGRAFGLVYLRREPGGVRVEVEQRLERILEPGEGFDLEPVYLELGPEASALLERFATAQGRRAGARTRAPFQSGWCSWYHHFLGVTEEILLRNVDALASVRDEIPVDVVQLDGGYQHAYGDWLETNEKFPSGLEYLARRVREAGFTPGIWTAPFCVVSESRVFREHRAWLLRDGDGLLRCLHDVSWSPDGWVYALDPTHPEVGPHLEHIFRTTVEMGFTYQKLDFLYAVALRAEAHDPRLTRAQRLRCGLAAIRAGAGEDAFVLGCGCPLGPAIGVVDGMRIGPDTGPWWAPLGEQGIAGIEPTLPGLEPTVPAARNALRNTLARAWMHRRLWLNDPDCLVARDKESQLTVDEVRTLAASVAVTGGMTIVSDDVSALGSEQRALIRETLRLARAVDQACADGGVMVTPLLAEELPPALTSSAASDTLVMLVNGTDRPVERAVRVEPGAGDPEPLLHSRELTLRPDGRLHVRLERRESGLYRFAGDCGREGVRIEGGSAEGGEDE
jgi:alpha-galactosidase